MFADLTEQARVPRTVRSLRGDVVLLFRLPRIDEYELMRFKKFSLRKE